MVAQPTILILTSKTGGGHVSLAESLRNQLVNDYKIHILDPQPHFFHLHYRLVSRYALWLWSAEFQLADTPRRALQAHRIFTRLVARPLAAALKQMQPDLVITTYPFLTYEVMQVLKKTRCHVPFVMLFTDPNGVHASWLTERGAAATLAPTRETYAQALSVGFAPERLHQVGWPVREQFYRVDPSQRAQTLAELGLDPARFTVFLQGGGEGAAQFGRTVERVLAINAPLQVILATGTNQALLARFQSVKNLYALPFTSEIAPFMAAADVIMGKAGPNMLFESVTLGKPFIATAYIPGQEEANLEFIRRHKLGWVALSAEQQQTLLARLAAQGPELQAMTSTVNSYRQWNIRSTEAIVPIIRDLTY
ncbi:MAG TPA: glycosyltransferase [Ktedonobacteraceae bacterium]|nr:glycosyltransferase [Ktedonobacteraceae bacterium]